MLRALTKTTCLVAGVFCLVALADRRNLTRPLWDKILPEVVLARQPSPCEAQTKEVEGRVETLAREIAALEKAAIVSREKRRGLLVRLRNQVGTDDATLLSNVERLTREDPVASALVRAIDAEDQRERDLARQLDDARAKRAQLEARLIALRNGVSQVEPHEPMRPSEQLRAKGAGETAADRHRRIVREAMELGN